MDENPTERAGIFYTYPAGGPVRDVERYTSRYTGRPSPSIREPHFHLSRQRLDQRLRKNVGERVTRHLARPGRGVYVGTWP